MIVFEHIWKSYGRGRKAKDVLTDVNATLDFSPGNIGILGTKKSGKTTLLNIIAGVIPPDSGRLRRRMRVSWPLSWRGFGGGMTGDGQVTFLARLYQANRRDTLRYVAELSRLDRKLYESTGNYSPREKDRLMLAIALALDFDAYLVDERMPPVEPGLAPDYEEAWRSRHQSSMMILVSSKPETLAAECSSAAILHQGQLSNFMPAPEAAQAYVTAMRRRRKPKRNAHAKQT